MVSKQGNNKDTQHRNSSSRFSLSLQPGDRVLVRNMSPRGGTGKMRDFWEEKVHVIVSRIGDNGVVYKAKQEDEGNRKIRVLHRNMIMKIDDMLDNFDWNVSISEKEKVKQKSESPKSTNRKIIQRTGNNEETAESDEEYPSQFAPGDLHMLLRSSKNNAKNVTKDLGNRSSKQYNHAAHSRKLSKEETYNQSEIDCTIDSSSNIKEPRIKNFTEIEKEPRIKNFIHIEDPNVIIHEEDRKNLFKGSWRGSSKEAKRNKESEKRRDKRVHLRYR